MLIFYIKSKHFWHGGGIQGVTLIDVLTVHDAIHSLARLHDKGVVLKLDYEKAFDTVNLDFLDELLKIRGFGCKWLGWIHK